MISSKAPKEQMIKLPEAPHRPHSVGRCLSPPTRLPSVPAEFRGSRVGSRAEPHAGVSGWPQEMGGSPAPGAGRAWLR